MIMDVLTSNGGQPSPEREFDQKAESRARRHEMLRGRNNLTLCRSPTRVFDSKLVKNELKEKRQVEYLRRRRSTSPELLNLKCANCSWRTKTRTVMFSVGHRSPSIKNDTMQTNNEDQLSIDVKSAAFQTQNEHLTRDPKSRNWDLLWSEEITLMKQGNESMRKKTSSSTVRMESKQTGLMNTSNVDSRINVQKTSMKTTVQMEKIHQNPDMQQKTICQKEVSREISVQTESSVIAVRESDIQRLSEYLQEALWREEAVKKKLSILQERATNLVNSSDVTWKSRCDEDLLKNKIKTLEAQLQICLQKISKDGVKRLVLQMEKQKTIYEEKALIALQKATQEKSKAINKAETLQRALTTTEAEVLRYRSLYKELKLKSGQRNEDQQLNIDLLNQLQSQLELSRTTEIHLREEIVSLRREVQELRYNISLLEDDNQTLRSENSILQNDIDTKQDFLMGDFLAAPEGELRPPVKRVLEMEEQLRQAQQKLQLKEKECSELQTELHTVEHECQSSLARLSQCREELRQFSRRHSAQIQRRSWWWAYLLFFFLCTVAGVTVMCTQPALSCRKPAENLCITIKTKIEDYLLEMASRRDSGLFRPV